MYLEHLSFEGSRNVECFKLLTLKLPSLYQTRGDNDFMKRLRRNGLERVNPGVRFFRETKPEKVFVTVHLFQS